LVRIARVREASRDLFGHMVARWLVRIGNAYSFRHR
jgi:hypothetical protein